MRKFFLFAGILGCAFFGCQDNEGGVSFKKIDLIDASDSINVINISFSYPAAMPSRAALAELQKNFIKQAFGEKYAGLEPSAIAKRVAEEFRFGEPCGNVRHELLLSDSAYVPIPGFLQYTTRRYEFTCGAHGDGYDAGCIYNLADGKKMELKEIFSKGWEQSVEELIKKEFLQKYGAENGLYGDGEKNFMPSSERLTLRPDGLVFFYPTYSIGPRPLGEPDVFLPWKALKPYLNEKSAIYPKLQF